MKSVAQTVIQADHFYTIAAKTGSVIQAVETKDGGDIRLGKYDHKPEQEWAFIREGDGVYRIRNRANGKLIDLMMTGTANGTWLHLWEDVSGTSQMWTLQPTPEGKVRLRSSWAGGKCIDTVGMGVADGAILQIWQETAGDDQLWTISEVKDRAKRAVKEEPTEAAVETPVVEEPKTEEPAKAETVEVKAEPAVETAPVEEKAAPAAEPVVEAKTEEVKAEAEVKAEEKEPKVKAEMKNEEKAEAKVEETAPAAEPAKTEPAKAPAAPAKPAAKKTTGKKNLSRKKRAAAKK